MGTVGGNLCLDTRCIFYNQSQWWRQANNHCLKTTGDICHVAPKSRGVCFATFSGDLAPALMTLGAEVDLIGPGGPAHAAAAAALHRPCAPRRLGRGRRQALSGAAAGRARHRRARPLRARPALGLRQDPHPPLDRVSGGGRRRGAAPRRRDARRSARRHHRHQPAPRAARGHAGAVRRPASTTACSRARRAGARSDHVDEDHLHARPLPPARRRRAGAPAGACGCSTPRRLGQAKR